MIKHLSCIISLILSSTILSSCALKSYETDIYSATKSSSKATATSNIINYGNGDQYTGDLVGGKPQGKGELKFANGDVYKGEFSNGKMDGEGVLTYAKGGVLNGKFTNDAPDSNHAFKLSNGDSFTGKFKQRQPYKGTLVKASGNTYVGKFVNGKLDGSGKEYLKNGEFYKGQFKSGTREGTGYLKIGDEDFFQKYVNGNVVYEAPGAVSIKNAPSSIQCLPSFLGNYVVISGSCEAGKLKGDALLVYNNSQKIIEGEFIDGYLKFGSYTTVEDGKIYEGYWLHNQSAFNYYQQGELFEKGKPVYRGSFGISGKKHGKGNCPYNNSWEPCEFTNDQRSDEIYHARIEQKRIQEWQNTCSNAERSISKNAESMTDQLSNFCRAEYAKIDDTVDWVFRDEDTMYMSTMNAGQPWIENSVKRARECRERAENNINYYANQMSSAENTLRNSNCPSQNQISQYRQLRRSVVNDMNSQIDSLRDAESHYIKLERDTRGAVRNKIEADRAQMWTDLANNFTNDMRSFSRELEQINRETIRLTNQAYAEADRRKKERVRIQQEAYQKQLQQFKAGYAADQKRKLDALNAKIAAQNKAIDDNIALSKQQCLKNPNNTWNAAGNTCNYLQIVEVKGWGKTEWAPNSAETGIYRNRSNSGSSGSGGSSTSSSNNNSSANSSSSSSGSYSSGGSGGTGGTTPSGSSSSKKSEDDKIGVCEHELQNCVIPVFVSDYENTVGWETEEAACKYSKAGAVRKAEAECKKKFKGRKAYKSEILQPVVDGCTTCRKIDKSGFGVRIIEYKCKSNVTMQCKLPR